MRFPPSLLASFCLACIASCPVVADGIPTASGFALDGMAPQGRWAARLTLLHNGYTQKFDNRGNMVDLDNGADGVALDANVLPALAPLGPGASLGTLSLDTRVNTAYRELALGYGVTNNLTVGLIVPAAQTRTKASFSVSGGNVGFNPLFDPALPVSTANYPFAPAGGAVAPLGTAGVRQLLTDPALGYAYKPPAGTSTSGIGDPTAGALWRFHQSARDSAILGFGVRFGLAEADDPNDLLDVPVSGGAPALRARLEYFRDLGAGFDLRLLAEHLEQLPDERTLRVPAPGTLLAPAASIETLDRDLGDYQEYDVEVGYRWGDWRTSATWHRFQKAADRYTSPSGADTSALTANTVTVADQWRLGVSWSGISAWQAGKLPLPLIVKLEMQDTFDGRNFVKVRDVYLRITTLF